MQVILIQRLRLRERLEMIDGLDFVILYVDNVMTLRRNGTLVSIIDVTFATARLAPIINSWKVLEDYTVSD